MLLENAGLYVPKDGYYMDSYSSVCVMLTEVMYELGFLRSITTPNTVSSDKVSRNCVTEAERHTQFVS